jgi:sulfur-oxidizing protein SoxY
MKFSRRRAMTIGGAALTITFLPYSGLYAATDLVAASIKEFTGGSSVGEGNIVLTTPEIAENGNTVPVSISAPGARRVMLLADGNPRPAVATFHFSKLAVPEGSTRIRLAKTQNILAVAELNDGSFTQVVNAVKVTIGGCGG